MRRFAALIFVVAAAGCGSPGTPTGLPAPPTDATPFCADLLRLEELSRTESKSAGELRRTLTARTETAGDAVRHAPARFKVDVTRILRFYRDYADFARSNDFDTAQMADAPKSELVSPAILKAAGRSGERLFEYSGEACARPYDVM